MSPLEHVILIVIFFITSAVGVVTGSNSLVTVPVMLQFGIDPKTAVATNMFGLTFMSMGASIPFLKGDAVDWGRMPKLVALTLVGSALGAAMVGLIDRDVLPVIIAASMFFVLAFMVLSRHGGITKVDMRPGLALLAAYTAVFVLAIHGGLFSGGYVTMLTACFVALFGKTFTEAVATTKVVNVFSSFIATVVFMWQGRVDYTLGSILAVTMFVAAYAGAKTVTKMNDVWLRRIFFAVVLGLALKTVADLALN